MEKCTYCVQRINAARILAKRESRTIRDGEVLTACQSVCPTDSIVFGNLQDPDSRVSQLKKSPRNYAMLDELNTRPRTTYLAAVRNPHPSLPHNVSVGGHETTHDAARAALVDRRSDTGVCASMLDQRLPAVPMEQPQ
jgi:molybdopterin-containing oxidoreductase family iron-sulfur binding subunit